MDLTIVICTHNREASLKRTVASLNQAIRPEKANIEIFIVANACRDGTVEWLHSYQKKAHDHGFFPIRWVEEPKAGKSYALNRALDESCGDVLCFIDDDQYILKNYFDELQKALLEYPEFEIFCGKLQPAWDGTEPSWVHTKGPFRIPIRPFPEYAMGDSVLEIKIGQEIPPGGNIIIRRSVFKRVGGFSLSHGPTGHDLKGGEDHEFIMRALRSHTRILYVPELKQLHAVDYTRMKSTYMFRKSYLRSRAAISIRESDSNTIPLWIFKKCIICFCHLLLARGTEKRRYYLIRVGSTIGELRGYIDRLLDK